MLGPAEHSRATAGQGRTVGDGSPAAQGLNQALPT
jgi:hypothetical protein